MAELNTPYRLASKTPDKQQTVVTVRNSTIGGNELFMIAGPCAVESERQLFEIAGAVHAAGVPFLRGGAFKPRTSPYNFQGLEKEGLRLLKQASDTYGLGIITEVMDFSLLDLVYPYTDIIQVGSRNMKNYHFLKELGKTDKPILLKRGMDATVDEWLLAAEYILLGGNDQVILCERGIRTFDQSLRNTLDLGSVALVKELSHLPIVVDPSQGTGKRSVVGAMSKAAVAVGADGLMIEVHNDPDSALSDGPQSLSLDQFRKLMKELAVLSTVTGKRFKSKTLEMIDA
ncbi:MAG: 3-deoxy-7-phosphoheptulonate synthase [Flavobacteriales bacterium]|nr:3-deoxy-7-phosphoheptulonate synthase [Flavobacteriales bacterium]